MYFVIDNYDSYVYNLIAYMKEIGMKIKIVKCDDSIFDVPKDDIEGIIISPGPKHPKDYDYISKLIEFSEGKIPILGVCLGHQMIAYNFGAKVVKGEKPMHGKLSNVTHKGKRLFYELPEKFKVTRYHSLMVDKSNFPKDELSIDAISEDGCIMAISHISKPIFGVQFHPEAVLTEYGYELIRNFKKICEGESLWQ
ncbi:MAG: aminodeoxychorismate/anthranilate synthase component II [Clostridium sp.]|nr:aminodeoxychorismate/anthranilate synthase component II [Clostridium sp.]